jgi:hypothetical protein
MKRALLNRTRRKLYLAITTTLAAFSTSFATAQQAPAASVEEIQITGSRVRLQDGMTAPTPVTVAMPSAPLVVAPISICAAWASTARWCCSMAPA